MKHRKKIIKLGRMSSHRKALFSNMAGSIILHKKIYTTLPKAKAVEPLVDNLITWAKEGSIHSRRLAFRILKDRMLVKRLFSEIPQAILSRNGGYTRIIKAGYRIGDGAPMAILELVGQEAIEETQGKGKKKEKQKSKQKPAAASFGKKEK